MTIKNNGNNVPFSTGAVRENKASKGRYDLIPATAIARLACHYEAGAAVYGDRNWERGVPLHSFIDSGLRHMFQLQAGDTSEDHAAAVLWNVAGYIWTKDRIDRGLLPAELADMPVAPEEQSLFTILTDPKYWRKASDDE